MTGPIRTTEGKYALFEPQDSTKVKSDVSDDLPDMPYLEWHTSAEMSNKGHVNLPAMIHPVCAFRSHNGCNAFKGVSDKFCSKYLLGSCYYGCLCNKRHELYARYDLESSLWTLTREQPKPDMDQTQWNISWLIGWAAQETGYRLWATRNTWPTIVRRLHGVVEGQDVKEIAADKIREILHIEWMDVNI